MAKQGILERLKDGIVLGDGGYLLELEKRGWVQAGPFTPEVVLRRPEAVKELHTEFKAAGAEVLQALTFYASRDKLATVGLEGKLEDMNRQAVRLAREVAGDDCLVAGNISLTWKYEQGSAAASDVVRQTFDEQLAVQTQAGVDFVIGETYSWLGEALLAVACGKKTGLPTMVTVCFENQDLTSDGKTAADCAKALVDAGADIVGINCLRNPENTLPLMEQMRKAVKVPLACQPVAYRTPKDKPDFTSLPEFPFELDVLQLSRKEMADYARRARDLGIGYI
ncbi:MAG TPA: homocysteine S-methyltransferase family protein, partial [Vicinamibacteria bacterium]